MTGGSDTGEQHILIIDDDDERLRLLLRRFLEESGFPRDRCRFGQRCASKVLDGIIFDLMIVDIMMPGETGLEFLADIRKDNAVPALFLTAMAETEHRIAGLESGADDYMSKPFEPRELVLGSGPSSTCGNTPRQEDSISHSALTVLTATRHPDAQQRADPYHQCRAEAADKLCRHARHRAVA